MEASLIRLEDIKQRLSTEKRLEEPKDKIQAKRKPESEVFAVIRKAMRGWRHAANAVVTEAD